MEYKRCGNVIIARIDKGEEITEIIREIAARENIQLAGVSAIGAIGSFTAGIFKVKEKKFAPREYKGEFEIVSLSGIINTMNGEFYCHLHMSAGDQNGNVYGGHMSRAVVSATCEMVITVYDGEVGRVFSDEIGLNLLDF